MNSLDPETRARIITALVEGCSINSVVRMTGVAHTTILRLIRDVGTACQSFHDAMVRNLGTLRVQCDEVWSFCYSKQKNVPRAVQGAHRLRLDLDLDGAGRRLEADDFVDRQ